MNKILLMIMLTMGLLGSTYQCQLYDLRYDNKKESKDFLNDNISIYFIKEGNTLTVQTISDKITAIFIESVLNEENEIADIYHHNDFLYAVYSNFKGGVRIVRFNETLDVINCGQIED